MRLLAEILALAGGVFVLLAGIGVVRFEDVYARMHAATKASTLGIGLIGVAAACSLDAGAGKAILAVVFIFITGPVAAHFVGRIAYRAEGVELGASAHDDLAAMMDEPDGDDG